MEWKVASVTLFGRRFGFAIFNLLFCHVAREERVCHFVLARRLIRALR